MTTSPQCAQLSGSKCTQAAQPAKNVQASATGSDTTRQRRVRTGWMNFSGTNIATDSAATSARMIQKSGLIANITMTTMFQQPGKPAKDLSAVFMLAPAI